MCKCAKCSPQVEDTDGCGDERAPRWGFIPTVGGWGGLQTNLQRRVSRWLYVD